MTGFDRDTERVLFAELDERGDDILQRLRAGRIDAREALRLVDELHGWAVRAIALLPERHRWQ